MFACVTYNARVILLHMQNLADRIEQIYHCRTLQRLSPLPCRRCDYCISINSQSPVFDRISVKCAQISTLCTLKLHTPPPIGLGRVGFADTQISILPAVTGSAMCVQRFDDSRRYADRITYRISLRSSSLWEPRHPLLKVVWHLRHMRGGRRSLGTPTAPSFLEVNVVF